MIKTFTNVLKTQKIQMYNCSRFNVMTKKPKLLGKKLSEDPGEYPELVDITEDCENKFKNVKVFQGKFPYMPIDDHPLIPGYARMMNISKELFDKLKEANVEQNQLVISVTKNPEQIEAIQLSMQQIPLNFVPNVKSKNEVYEFGCLCEVKLREEKHFGVLFFNFFNDGRLFMVIFDLLHVLYFIFEDIFF